jgi:RimJ/RimL family protein N-acetyltransferase/predicted GNAT family acetyltransferase
LNDDMLDRIRHFAQTLENRVAARHVSLPHGTGLYVDALAHVYDCNGVRIETGGSAGELAAEIDEAMVSFLHRRAHVYGEQADLVAGFRELGWSSATHLVMARRRPADRAADTTMVEEVPFERLVAARRLVTLREPWGDELLAEQLDEAKRRVAAAVPTRYFAALVEGEIAAYCELRGDGQVAQIEDVDSLEEFRGRGLGRAVVQRAIDEARGHDVVFLEAFANDWPRELYAKLGFDVVGERQVFTVPANPLACLRLRTPRLELRLATRAELRELAAVARAGIHDPDAMPFVVPWTDRADEPAFVEEFVEFHDARLRDWRPDSWHIELVVFHDGRPIGVQALIGKEFARDRTVVTGSWLGRPWQGRGFGTEMRTAVLALAFSGLGAEVARSGALLNNEQSLGVSRKLGYTEVGMSSVAPRGVPVAHHDLELHRAEFEPPIGVRIDGLELVRRQFTGEDG